MGFLDIPQLGQVHYHEYGTGSKPLLAFHGYGMTGRQFHVLEKSILPEYRVYGFDHFFHGESRLKGWSEKQILAGMPKQLVRSYAEEWFAQHGMQRFSVLGYSIGANLALILVEEYPHLIDEVILMAPDGLFIYKGFHFLMHNNIGKLFFGTVTKSQWIAPLLLKTLKRIRFIDENLYKIAWSEMDTEKKRLDVYYTLNLLRPLKPDTEKVAALINQHNIPCRLIFGKRDNLFPKIQAVPFLQTLKDAEVHEVDLGHWLVIKELDEYLAKFKV